MPFSKDDVAKYNKDAAKDSKKSARWVAVANSALAACIKEGGSDKTCAPKAITQANGVIKKMNEQENPDTEETTEQEEMYYGDVPRPMNYPGYYAAMSFSDLDAAEKAGKLRDRLQRRADQYFELFWRIWNNDEIPVPQKVSQWESLHNEFISILESEVKTEPEEAETVEFQFAESSFGNISIVDVNLEETDPGRAPLTMEVEVIQPGFGNKRDNHYYPADVLKRDASVFEGVKMYATNHRENERSERTEVSIIDKIIGFSEKGAPIARVTVFDPAFAEKTRNRQKAGKLETLECSILASGKARKGDVNGKKANIVESITHGHAVDWVTSAGAGGRAKRLVENEPEVDNMEPDTEEVENEEVQEEANATFQEDENEQVEPVEAPVEPEGQPEGEPEDEPEPVVESLSEAQVTEILSSFNKLPVIIGRRVRHMHFADADDLKEYVNDEIEHLKEQTRSGKPNHGKANDNTPPERTIQERQIAKDAVLEKYGF